jgi:hypothetical protein
VYRKPRLKKASIPNVALYDILHVENIETLLEISLMYFLRLVFGVLHCFLVVGGV